MLVASFLSTNLALASGTTANPSGPSDASKAASDRASDAPSDAASDATSPTAPSDAKAPSRSPKSSGAGGDNDDPLAIPPEDAERMGTDVDPDAVAAEEQDALPAPTERRFFPLYEERRGTETVRLLPPLVLEHIRDKASSASTTAAAQATATTASSSSQDREGLYGLLYYRRRSPRVDADVLFPLAWRMRHDNDRLWVLGPVIHREAPASHDNWLAPLFFEGERPRGGYFHAPLLLTSSRWSEDSAFTLVGPYFRHRTQGDVDLGVAPLFFHGDNGNEDGARRRYTLIPPLFYYRRYQELTETTLTVAGPVMLESSPKATRFNIFPLFFHRHGLPESGGTKESTTTFFPFFHYGRTDEESLFVAGPFYLHRTTPTVDTLLTPLYSRSTTRSGATRLDALGPIVPLFFRYRDEDTGAHALSLAPLFHTYSSPTASAFLTPLYGQFETRGLSKTRWIFPSLTISTETDGWSTNLHPLFYFGRHGDSSHNVVAPLFWDFADKAGRTTIGFPLFWRFTETSTRSVTQVAVNTLYRQKRVAGGLDWQFHLLPIFSYGASPTGYFWNVLFGLAGYERDGDVGKVKALWIPIQVRGGSQGQGTEESR